MHYILPFPLLSGIIFLLWLVLNQSASASSLCMAFILAIAIPKLTQSLRPNNTKVSSPLVIIRLLCHVAHDVVVSNLILAKAILHKNQTSIRSGFVHIPLDTRAPQTLAALAMIVSITPGTAWAELALDRSVLMLHVYPLDDEAALITQIKNRYERPLMEIFE